MDFLKRVGYVCDNIPFGMVATYGQLARLCGKPCGARQVGRALSWDVSKMAHRVVNSRGFLSGADAFGFAGTQRALLESEGIQVSENQTVDLTRYGWRPSDEELERIRSHFEMWDI